MLGPHVEALTWVGLKEGRTTCWPPCGGSNLGRVEGGEEDMLGSHVEALTWVGLKEGRTTGGSHVEALTWVGLKEGRTTCLAPMWRL